MPNITRIVVTELEPDTLNPEPWEVQWNGWGGVQRQKHDSKEAAQRHVSGLLQNLAPGVTKDDALTINYRT